MNKLMPPELWVMVDEIRKENIKYRGERLGLEFPMVLASHRDYFLFKCGKHHWAVEGDKVKWVWINRKRVLHQFGDSRRPDDGTLPRLYWT